MDTFEPRIRALPAEFAGMRATVIAERVGWPRSITVLRRRVPELRPADIVNTKGDSYRLKDGDPGLEPTPP